MIKLTGNDAINSWCIYTLHDLNKKLIFVFTSKLSTVCSLRDVISNPAFDVNATYTFTIAQIYNTQTEAHNALYQYVQMFGMPELNKTVRFNRFGKVRCNETGQIWRNQNDCAKTLGINQGQLSLHLRRSPGYKTIKGLTFTNVTQSAPQPQAVQYPQPTASINPAICQ